MSGRLLKYAGLVLGLWLVVGLIGCAPAQPAQAPAQEEAPAQEAAPAQEEAPAEEAAAEEAPAEEAPAEEEAAAEAPAEEEAAEAGAMEGMPAGYEGKTWDDILAEASGQTVNWYQWGGSDAINNWVNGFVADNMQEQFNVTVNMVPVVDATEFVNKVLGEKEAGRDEDGSVDLMWINGENFRTMKEADLLYGPWAYYVPNAQYFNFEDPSIANDFGYPMEGYELPYSKAQVVMIYDSARVPEPPTTIEGLVEWIKANPGKFTYPAPPDFTGSVFVRHLFYHYAGGYEQFLGDFDEELYNEKAPAVWEALRELEPSLWREGETYPETHPQLQDLFANGEVYFDMSYGPSDAARLIEQGKYPETTRTYVFDSGTIGNTNYVAIAYNSPHKAGAMVLANFLASMEATYDRANPEVWGTLPAFDPARIPAEWQQKFNEIPRHEATLPSDVLNSHQIPELQSTYLTRIEQDWEQEVLQK
jgi:putative spermidine/putrescine transport system substrate-binding protein